MADDVVVVEDDIVVVDDDVTVNDLIIAGNNTPAKQSIDEQLRTALTTSQRLFIVAGVMDLTNFIVVPSYQVNLQDGYEEWDDNNKVHHRDINSQKAKGTFQVKFFSVEEYQTFMIVMKDYKKQNGAYDCTVFCNNTLTTYNVEMFIDFEAANVMPYIGAQDYDPIDITVEQRSNLYIPS